MHIRVLPRDVAPLDGPVLDPTLLDVTALIENADDDVHRSTVPLIVQAEAGASGPAAAAALPGALPQGETLSSINAVAVRVPKSGGSRVGRALAAMASGAVRAGRATPLVTGRIRYIWLDRTVQVSAGR